MQIPLIVTVYLFLTFIKVAFVQANVITARIFVSESLGNQVLDELLKNLSGETVLIRGLSTCSQNLTSALYQLQKLLIINNPSASVEINPIAFEENRINRVPAISLQVNGKTEITAFGVTSVDWLKRQYQAGRRGNLGTFGATYPISEPDLLEVLFQRLEQQDWQSIQAKAYKRFITTVSRLTFTLASTFDLYRTARADSPLSIDRSTCIADA